MNKHRKTHQKYFIINTIVASLMIVLILLVVYFMASRVIGQAVYNQEIKVQKEILQHNVDNICADIDWQRDYLRQTHPEMTDEQIKQQITNELYGRIHNETHMGDSYMWVEQVLNYDGGDNYAIRLIHPNLRQTEGSYLSTNRINENGEYIYRDELEGVKKEGAIFSQYHFKELNSDRVTEKITYARLYKDYDWIIGMGVNTEVLEEKIGTTADIMRPYMIRTILALGIIITAFSIFLQKLIMKKEKAIFRVRQKRLQNKLNWDQNTRANSRIYGEEMLQEELQRTKDGINHTVVMMLDIDNFKKYNDTYGHEVGDQVLYEVVQSYRSVTRTTDSLIRWGGDEFVGILRGVDSSGITAIQEKILAAIRKIDIGTSQITVSLGFTEIYPQDNTVEEVLKRADEALYETKRKGRNGGSVKLRQ